MNGIPTYAGTLIISLLAAFSLGVVLALAYVALLWASVKHLSRYSSPALWLAGTTLIRMNLLIAAGYFLVRNQQSVEIACVAIGFVFARWLVLRYQKRLLESKPVAINSPVPSAPMNLSGPPE